MITSLVRSVSDDRGALHEAGEAAARRAIRSAFLAVHRDIEPDSIIVEKDALGKPYGRVRGYRPKVAVSISHSFPYALATSTITCGIALGADVERIRDFASSTSEAFLTCREKKIIACAPSGARKYLRTLCWSLKESSLKALGTGLRVHPRQVDISRLLMGGCASNTIEIKGVMHRVEARFWQVDGDFIATIVVLPRFSVYDWLHNPVWIRGKLLSIL